MAEGHDRNVASYSNGRRFRSRQAPIHSVAAGIKPPRRTIIIKTAFARTCFVDRGFSRDIYSASDEAFNPWAEISRLLIFGGTRSATALFRAPFLKSSAAQG